MDSNAFLCPTCKVALAPTPAEAMVRCPQCGAYFSTPPPLVQQWPKEKEFTVLRMLGVACIYIIAVVGGLLALAFAGCLAVAGFELLNK